MDMEQRVLIIDSDLESCKAIKYALRDFGIGAYYALSVVDGIDRLMRHGYQLVILDISLSETDGLELLRFMRQMKDMPILVLSFQGGIDHRSGRSAWGRMISWKSPWSSGSVCSGPRPCSGATMPPAPP